NPFKFFKISSGIYKIIMLINISDWNKQRFVTMMSVPNTLEFKFREWVCNDDSNIMLNMYRVLNKTEYTTKFVKTIYSVKVLLEVFRRSSTYKYYLSTFNKYDDDFQRSQFLKKQMVHMWNLLNETKTMNSYDPNKFLSANYQEFLKILRNFNLCNYHGDINHAIRAFMQTEMFYFIIVSTIYLLHINEVIIRGEADFHELYRLDDYNKMELINKYFILFQKEERFMLLYSDITLNTFFSSSILQELREYCEKNFITVT
ncbi:hypothetical protein SNEBB_010299, partial [Seison nebaliae]